MTNPFQQRLTQLGALALIGTAIFAACGSDSSRSTDSGSDSTSITTSNADNTGATDGEGTIGSTTPTPSTTSATSAVDTVDANDASIDELAAAFEAAGVENADRWAREVDEYRPYPTDDPTFAKLRGELSKYNPSPETVDLIISVLSL